MTSQTKCANPGCDQTTIFARGYCGGCYYRLRRNGTLERKNVVNLGACQTEGCERKAFAKNLCAKHYQQAQHPLRAIWSNLRARAQGAYPPAWDRIEHFLADIGPRPSPRHQLRRPNPLLPWSTENMVWREPILIDRATKEGRAKYAWIWHIRDKYGLTPEDILAMAEEQNNLCGICPRELGAINPDTGKSVRVCVDHDHLTNQVRGLLCDYCNKALGLFNDDPVRCRRSADYLEGRAIK